MSVACAPGRNTSSWGTHGRKVAAEKLGDELLSCTLVEDLL